MTNETIFFSYSRDNSEFVLQLAKDLRDAGAKIWLDQLDITPGTHWDSSIENALQDAGILLVVLSKSSVESNNVMDEVSYALEKEKKVVPVLLEECEIPFRLGRLQYADFTKDRATGLETLVQTLSLNSEVASKLGVKKVKVSPPPKAPSKPISEPTFVKKEQAPVYSPPPSYEGPTKQKSNKSWILLVLLLLVGAGAGLWYTGMIDLNSILPSTSKDAWKVALEVDSEAYYLSYIEENGMDDAHYNEAFDKIKSMYSKTGYIQYSDSDGTTRYFNLLSGTGKNGEPLAGDILKATDDRSVRIGVIGVNDQTDRNGDVVATGEHVIVAEVIMSGTATWLKINYQ